MDVGGIIQLVFKKAMAQFDFTGKNLVVSQRNGYVALASIEDFSIGKPLQSGWAHSCSPYSPYVAIFQTPNPRQNKVGFKLHNVFIFGKPKYFHEVFGVVRGLIRFKIKPCAGWHQAN